MYVCFEMKLYLQQVCDLLFIVCERDPYVCDPSVGVLCVGVLCAICRGGISRFIMSGCWDMFVCYLYLCNKYV